MDEDVAQLVIRDVIFAHRWSDGCTCGWRWCDGNASDPRSYAEHISYFVVEALSTLKELEDA